MQQLLEFLRNHIALAFAFFFLLGMLIWTFVSSPRGVKRVGPTDATRLINQEDAVVLDVRGDGEYNQGHVLNAIHIPASALGDRLSRLESYRERPIITVCRTGQQSAEAGRTLHKGGFRNIYVLGGGILAWQDANLPLVKK